MMNFSIQDLSACHKFFRQDLAGKKRTIIFIGTEHASSTSSFISMSAFGAWKTPLGSILSDSDMCYLIQKESKGYIEENNSSFATEHSIENQLPFLQYFEQYHKEV